jgi:hypothetical protein
MGDRLKAGLQRVETPPSAVGGRLLNEPGYGMLASGAEGGRPLMAPLLAVGIAVVNLPWGSAACGGQWGGLE